MPGWSRLVTVAGATLLTTSCIGATDRADFDDEVRRRGGGITTAWVDEGLDAAAEELAVSSADDLEVLTLSINGTSRSLTVNARRGDRPDFVDSVTVREGDVVAVAPIQDADDLPLDELTVGLDEVPLDDLEMLVDVALSDFGEPDAFVTTITVSLTDGVPTITMRIESARRTGSAVFDADGELRKVER